MKKNLIPLNYSTNRLGFVNLKPQKEPDLEPNHTSDSYTRKKRQHSFRVKLGNFGHSASVSQFSLEKILVRPAFVSAAFAYLSPNHGDFCEDKS